MKNSQTDNQDTNNIKLRDARCLGFLLAGDAIERIDIAILEIRHLQENLASLMSLHELNMLLRYEEEFLWCNVERLPYHGSQTQATRNSQNQRNYQSASWDDLFLDTQVKPAMFHEFATLWVPYLPRHGNPGTEAFPFNTTTFSDVALKTTSPFWQARVLYPLYDRIRHNNDTGRIDEQFGAQYRCFDALQTLKRNLLIDKLHLCWWTNIYNRETFASLIDDANAPYSDPPNQSGVSRTERTRLAEMLIVRRGALYNLETAITELESLKGQFGRDLDLEAQDGLRPMSERRREQGLFTDVLQERARNIYLEIDKLFEDAQGITKRSNDPIDSSPNSAQARKWRPSRENSLHFSGPYVQAKNKSITDRARSSWAYLRPDENDGLTQFDSHLIHSSFFMPDRPDLQPQIAHEAAHLVIRTRLAELVNYSQLHGPGSVTTLLRQLIRQIGEYSRFKYISGVEETSHFAVELLCDLISLTVFGPSYLYSLALELTGHHTEAAFTAFNQDLSNVDLSLASSRFNAKGFANELFDPSELIRLEVSARWLNTILSENERDEYTNSLIIGIIGVNESIFEYIGDGVGAYDSSWRDVARYLAGDLFELAAKSDFQKKCKHWRSKARKWDKATIGEADTSVSRAPAPYHSHHYTERLRQDVRRKLIRHVIAAKVERNHSLSELEDDQKRADAYNQIIRNLFPDHRATVRPDSFDKDLDQICDELPIFRHLYDIPWQSTLIRGNDLLEEPTRKKLLFTLSNDFAPGREAYTVALEFVSFEQKRPSQRIAALTRLVVNLCSSPSLNDEDAYEKKGAWHNQGRKRILDYHTILECLFRNYTGVPCDTPLGLALQGTAVNNSDRHAIIHLLVHWYFGREDSELGIGGHIISTLSETTGFDPTQIDEARYRKELRAFFKKIFGKNPKNAHKKKNLGKVTSQFNRSGTSPGDLKDLIKKDLQAIDNMAEIAHTGADILCKDVVKPIVSLSKTKGSVQFNINEVHRLANDKKRRQLAESIGVLSYLAISPYAGDSGVGEAGWRIAQRMHKDDLPVYETICRMKLGALAKEIKELKLNNKSLSENPAFCGLYQYADNFGLYPDKGPQQEAVHVDRVLKKLTEENSDRFCMRKISRLSITDSVSYWRQTERPKSVDTLERVLRARARYDISRDENNPVFSRFFSTLGKYDTINIAEATPVWRWPLPVHERLEGSIEDIENQVVEDLVATRISAELAHRSDTLNRNRTSHNSLAQTKELHRQAIDELEFRIKRFDINKEASPLRKPSYLWERKIYPFMERRELGTRIALCGYPLDLTAKKLFSGPRESHERKTGQPESDVLAFISVRLHRRQSRVEFLSRLHHAIEEAENGGLADPNALATMRDRQRLPLAIPPMEQSGHLFEVGDHAYLTEGWSDLLVTLVETPELEQGRIVVPDRLLAVFMLEKAISGDWMVDRTELHLRPSAIARAIPKGDRPHPQHIGSRDETDAGLTDPGLTKADEHSKHVPACASPTKPIFFFRQDVRLKSDRTRATPSTVLIARLQDRCRVFHAAGIAHRALSTVVDENPEFNVDFNNIKFYNPDTDQGIIEASFEHFLDAFLKEKRRSTAVQMGKEAVDETWDIPIRSYNHKFVAQQFFDGPHRLILPKKSGGTLKKKERKKFRKCFMHQFQKEVKRRKNLGERSDRRKDLLDCFVNIRQATGKNDITLVFARRFPLNENRHSSGTVSDVRQSLQAWCHFMDGYLARNCPATDDRGSDAALRPLTPSDGFSTAARGLHWLLPWRDSEDVQTFVSFDHVASSWQQFDDK